jgi:hypothetical protein
MRVTAPGLTAEALDAQTHLLRVGGDPLAVRREMRTLATTAIVGGSRVLIVDIAGAESVESPLAWELTRADERLSWRGGRVIVVAGAHAIERLFDAFALHRAPEVVTSLGQALASADLAQKHQPA